VTHMQRPDTRNRETPFDKHTVTASGCMEETCAQCLFARAEFHKDMWKIVSWRFQQGPERANPAQSLERSLDQEVDRPC
jgi:hypothetical protein